MDLVPEVVRSLKVDDVIAVCEAMFVQYTLLWLAERRVEPAK